MGKISGCAKAIIGGVIASLTYAIPVVDDGLMASEACGIALAFVVGFNGVYWVKNHE